MIARAIATLGYVGLAPKAPGTWGSLVSVFLAAIVYAIGGFLTLLSLSTILFFVGWWATEEVTKGKDDHDPGEVVIDELVGQWITFLPFAGILWAHGNTLTWLPWPGLVAGFILFRAFDIFKPWPVSWADRKNTSFGVMLDDVLAGVMAAIILLIMGRLAHGALGL